MFLGTVCFAQETATLSGTVTENGEYPILGANILVVSTDEEYTDEYTTGWDGDYTFDLPLKSYEITVTASGYYDVQESLTVTNTEPITLDFALTPKPLPIMPKMPENFTLSRIEDGKIKLEWDAVIAGLDPLTYEDVTLESPELVTYSVQYCFGDFYSGTPIVAAVGNNTSYIIEEALSEFGIYNFAVKAMYEEGESGQATTVSINTIDENQVLISDANRMSYAYANYPFVSQSWESANVSGISQTVYSVEEMGGAMYIDKLNFFLPSKVNGELSYKISLGYKDSDVFSDASDFVPQESLTEVFNGIVNFNSLIVTIPITRFYYDGTKPLVMQLSKPFDGQAGISTYVNAPADPGSAGYNNLPNKAVMSISLTDDVSEMTASEDFPGKSTFKGVAALVVNKSDDVSIGKELSSAVTMFPNPSADGKFFVDVPASSKVEVFNAAGVLLTSRTFESEGIHEINLSSQNKGVYFLRINSNNKVQTIKALYK